MTTLNSALKAAKFAIKEKNFGTAVYNSELALRYDPNNYHARVFLGLANFNMQEFVASEKWYLEAIELQPQNPLAYQGILSLYQARNHTAGQAEIWKKLAHLARIDDDSRQYHDNLQKLWQYYQEIDDREGEFDLLKEILSYEDIIPSQFSLAVLLERLLELDDRLREEEIKKEVSLRKVRLGASPAAVIQLQVEQEIINRRPSMEYFYERLLALADTTTNLNPTKVAISYFKYLLFKLPAVQSPASKLEIRNVLDSLTEKLSATDCDMILQYYLESQDIFSLDDLRLPPSVSSNSEFSELLSMIKGKTHLCSPADAEHCYLIIGELYKKYSGRVLGFLLIDILSFLENWSQACDQCLKTLEYLQKQETICKLSTLKSRLGVEFMLDVSKFHLSNDNAVPLWNRLSQFAIGRTYDSHIVLALFECSLSLKSTDEWLKQYAGYNLDPGNPALSEALGIAYYEKGDFHESLSHLMHAKELLSCGKMSAKTARSKLFTRSFLSFNIGRTYWCMGGKFRREKEYAYRYLLIAAREQPQSELPFKYLAMFYDQIEVDLDRRLKCLGRAFENNPKDVDSAQSLHDMFLTSHQYDSSAIICLKVVDSSKSFSERKATLWAAKFLAFYFKLGNLDLFKTVYYCQHILKINAEDEETWLLLGQAYNDQGRFSLALKAFSRAISDPAKNSGYLALAYFRKGQVHMLLCEYQNAIWSFSLAIATLSRDKAEISSMLPIIIELSLAYRLQADMKNGLGYFGDAVQYYEKGLMQMFPFAQSLIHCHEVWSALSSFFLSAYQSRMPHNVVLNHEIVEIYSRLFNVTHDNPSAVDLAICAIERAISISPLRPDYYIQLAIALRTRGDNDIAADACYQAIKLQPQAGRSWNVLASICFNLHPQVFQFCLSRVVELTEMSDNAIAEIYSNLGCFYRNCQDNMLAMECYEIARVKNPELVNAWIGLSVAENLTSVDQVQLISHAVKLSEQSPQATAVFVQSIVKSREYLDNHRMRSTALFLLSKSRESPTVAIAKAFLHESSRQFSQTLAGYSKSKSNLARILCSLGKHESSLNTGDKLPSEFFCRCIVDATNLYFLGKFQESVNVLQCALDLNIASRDVFDFMKVLQAKVLIAVQSEGALARAQSILIECSRSDSNLSALVVIMALGLSMQEYDICEAAQFSMSQSSFTASFSKEACDLVELKALHMISIGKKQRALSEVIRSLRIEPTNLKLRLLLCRILERYFPSDHSSLTSASELLHIPLVDDSGAENFCSFSNMLVLSKTRSNSHASLLSVRQILQKCIRISPLSFEARVLLCHVQRLEIFNQIICGRVDSKRGSCLLIELLNILQSFFHYRMSKGLQVSIAMYCADLARVCMQLRGNIDILPVVKQLDECLSHAKYDGKKLGLLTMARCLSQLNMSDESNATIAFLEECFRDSTLVRKLNGLMQCEQGLLDAAFSDLQNISASAGVYLGIIFAAICIETDRLDQAIDRINSILKWKPQSSHARYLQAIVLQLRGNPGKAKKIFSSVGDFAGKTFWTRL